jgi:hypothetical protein
MKDEGVERGISLIAFIFLYLSFFPRSPCPYCPPFSLFPLLFVFSLKPLNGCLLVSIEIARVRDFNLLDKEQSKQRRKIYFSLLLDLAMEQKKLRKPRVFCCL